MKDKLLRKIGNTIICNLRNTDDIGLFHGKMGTCMFLYGYSLYEENAEYKQFADNLFSDINVINKNSMTSDIANGYGGIGVGMCWLFQHHRPDNEIQDLLKQYDQLLLNEVDKSMQSDLLYNSPYLSSSVYWLWRSPLYESSEREAWHKKISEAEKEFEKKKVKNIAMHISTNSDSFWWDFVLKRRTRIDLDAYDKLIHQWQNNYIYEMPTINGFLSSLGLHLLQIK